MSKNRNTSPDRVAHFDIVERLRSLRLLHVPIVAEYAEEAAAEIERLRNAIRRLADQDATLSVQGGNVTVTMDATLTDEEREAIELLVEYSSLRAKDEMVFRSLLKRARDQSE